MVQNLQKVGGLLFDFELVEHGWQEESCGFTSQGVCVFKKNGLVFFMIKLTINWNKTGPMLC